MFLSDFMINIINSFYRYFLKYIKKRLHVFTFILFLIVSILSLTSFKIAGYNIFVEFNNAYRIKKGTNVNLRGVLIGYADTITIQSNKVVILIHINSSNTLIPRNSLIEANQMGLFNDISIDITPLDNCQDNYDISPNSRTCINSSFVCSNFYLRGYKGLNYDDLVRATTRISQRFDDPRFFSLFYLLLNNLVDISDEILCCVYSMSGFSYLLRDLFTVFFLSYLM